MGSYLEEDGNGLPPVEGASNQITWEFGEYWSQNQFIDSVEEVIYSDDFNGVWYEDTRVETLVSRMILRVLNDEVKAIFQDTINTFLDNNNYTMFCYWRFSNESCYWLYKINGHIYSLYTKKNNILILKRCNNECNDWFGMRPRTSTLSGIVIGY